MPKSAEAKSPLDKRFLYLYAKSIMLSFGGGSVKAVKFGVFSDLHVDIMHDTQSRLQVFLDACRAENVDFIIHLGDFCYPDNNRKVVCRPEHMPVNIANALKVKTYADKPAILRLFNDFEKPSYHVLGNHECDMCSKQELLNFIEAKNGSFYSFDQGGFHFVVLDTNFVKTADGQFFAYENGNYFESGFRSDWQREWVSPDQLQWLEADLAQTAYPTIVFCHASLSMAIPSKRAVQNRDAIRNILKAAPKGVLACFNGHHHIDLATQEDGIWYVQINSMSCQWVDVAYACKNRYGQAIDEKYPNIQYTAPYKDPIFAIVTMDDQGIALKGTTSSFVGPDPEALGMHLPDSPWLREYGNRGIFSTAAQQDRYLPF